MTCGRLRWQRQHRHELIDRAHQLGLSGELQFILSSRRADLRELLDRADLFLMPSRTEGMPWALLEAMGRALRCIATRVGGTRRCSTEDMTPPNGPAALALRIVAVLSTRGRMAEISRGNLETARQFRLDILQQRHLEFESTPYQRTNTWRSAQPVGSCLPSVARTAPHVIITA